MVLSVDDYWPIVYDRIETQREDLALLRSLIPPGDRWTILEPFCGNGRLLIPLAEDGHTLVGIDRSGPMLASAQAKIRNLSADVGSRTTLKAADVTATDWPAGSDLVLLAANCFYELATANDQETCIVRARRSLKPGGWLYLDNDHMEGDLAASWSKVGEISARPSITCPDGAVFSESLETVWVDRPNRLWRARRTAQVRTPDGRTLEKEWIQQKHPPSTGEMRSWLVRHGFEIVHLWGDRRRTPYTPESDRAIFWCRLP